MSYNCLPGFRAFNVLLLGASAFALSGCFEPAPKPIAGPPAPVQTSEVDGFAQSVDDYKCNRTNGVLLVDVIDGSLVTATVYKTTNARTGGTSFEIALELNDKEVQSRTSCATEGRCLIQAQNMVGDYADSREAKAQRDCRRQANVEDRGGGHGHP